MNNKLNNQKMKILIPYRSYDNVCLIYRKSKQMSEFEAMILSFIYVYSKNKQLKILYFFDVIYERLNLDKNKWKKLIIIILKKFANEKIIVSNNDFEDEKLQCYEIELNKIIINNLTKKKFIGIDNKDISKQITFNYVFFESIAENNKHIISDEKFIEYEDYCDEQKYLYNYAIENYINVGDENKIIGIAKNQEKENKYFLNIKKFNKNDFFIKFRTKEINDIQLTISHDQISVSSTNKDYDDIINKYKEHNLENLLLYSINENKKNYMTNLEETSHFDLIPDINEYNQLFKNKDVFIKYNQKKLNLCLKDEKIYQIYKKTFKWNNKDVPLVILKEESILEHIKTEIKEFKNENCLDLIDYMNDIEKNNFNNFIKENINKLLDKPRILRYFISHNLSNKTQNQIIWLFLNSHYVLNEHWKLIVRKLDNSKIHSFINEFKKIKANESNLIYEKMKYLIDVEELEYFEPYFNLPKFNNLIKYFNELEALSKNQSIELNKLIESKNFWWSKMKNEFNFNYQLNKKLNNILDVIKNKISTLTKQNLETYIIIHQKMNMKLESILDVENNSNETLNLKSKIDLVDDKDLKNKLHTIREMRNKFAHSKENNLLNERESLEIIKQIDKVNDNLKWLEINENRIKASIKEIKR